eukprot:9185853-Pyramimonas_sp.AAC.2
MRLAVPKNDFSHYEEPPAYTSSTQYIPNPTGPRRSQNPGQSASSSGARDEPRPDPHSQWEDEERRPNKESNSKWEEEE